MKVLITGASSGIGKDIARVMSKKADELVLVARNVEKLEEIKKELEKDAKIEIISKGIANIKEDPYLNKKCTFRYLKN